MYPVLLAGIDTDVERVFLLVRSCVVLIVGAVGTLDLLAYNALIIEARPLEFDGLL